MLTIFQHVIVIVVVRNGIMYKEEKQTWNKRINIILKIKKDERMYALNTEMTK